MDSIFNHIRHSIMNSCNAIVVDPSMNLDRLRQTEWSSEFEKYMRNRMIQGSFRHGRLNGPDKSDYDRTAAIETRLSLYSKTRNKEYLVDIANLCMLEFVEGDGEFISISDTPKTRKV